MSKSQWLTPVLGLAALGAAACEAGSLENREEFQAALAAREGAGPDADASDAPGQGDATDSPMEGGAMAPSGDGMEPGGASADDPAMGASGAGSAGSAGDAAEDPMMMEGEPGTEEGCAEGCELIQMRCATAGCHDAATSLSGLNLAADGLLDRIVDAPASAGACAGETYIDSASPDASLLLGKIQDPPTCGSRMPLGVPLSEDEIDCIRRWVANPECGGAP